MKKVNKIIPIVFVIVLFTTSMLFAGTAPYLEILSPKRGEEIPFGGTVVIAVSVYDADGDTDVSSVEFIVDNKEITSDASVSALLTTYTFPETTDPGRHTFSLSIKDREGNITEVESYFNISPKPERERRYTMNGSVRAGAEYDKEGDPNGVGVMNLNMYGNVLENVDYALAVDLTNEKSSDEQRLSTFRLDLSSGIGTLVLGDTTPVFSSYMIDGREVFGVHALPQFGPIGFELLYGRSYKGVDELDLYKQMVYGWRFKAGNARRFLWALSFLKVKDDKDSITGTGAGETPKDNIVLGTDFTLSLVNGKVRIKAEANESLLNEDITDGAADFPDNELPFDPEGWEWLFTINEHIVPLVPGFANFATKLSLELGPFYDNQFNAEVSYIGPSYYSLGNETLVNDKAGLKMWDNIWLLNRKLFIQAAYQHYRDNLEDTLTYTTNTAGYSGSTYIYPTDYLSINAGFDVLTASNKHDVDTINTTINIGATQNIEIFNTNSNLYGNGSATLVKDKVVNANSSNDYSLRLGLISYFNDFPLDTKAMMGYDFGDSPDSLYLEGRGGYRFLPGENLYAYVDAIYETGPEELDLTLGSTFDMVSDITLEGTIEYITSPLATDFFISMFATKEF